MKTTVHVALLFAIAAGSALADTLALVAADSTAAETAAQQAFQATGKFTSVTVIDTQKSTPDLAALQGFTHILAWTVAAPADRVALGNVLANFYDLGGKHLTVATYTFSTVPTVPPFNLPDPELQGLVMNSPYAGFTNTQLIGNLSGALVPVVPNDPVWAGVDPTKVLYFENQYMAHPQLAQGATLVAADGSGAAAIGLIARSQNGVINVNFYPGGPQGESAGNNNAALFQLLTNTFPASQTITDTIPPTTSATVQPAPASTAKGWNNSNVTIALTAIDNPSGSGVKQITTIVGGVTSVVTGNQASIPVTAEGSTTVTFYATDNAGNVESQKMFTVLVDKTAPTVTATPNPLPDPSGHNTTPVTVTFTGADSLSGVASCTQPITLTASGTATGTCTDIAGNTSAPVSKTITIVSPDPPTPAGGGTGPVIHGVPAAGSCILRPADNQLVHAATLSVDPAQTATFDVAATSNEPPDTDNDDIEIKGTGLAPRVVRLRAEHGPKGVSIVYTITAKASGKSGQTTTATFTCTAPPDQNNDHDGPRNGDHDGKH
ncbi:MAG TPA: hypothetical protein VKT49_09870 [Bryobacteraceae bacterium]|nr:hypothetical protein [Bryobacteraceae bacterium]